MQKNRNQKYIWIIVSILVILSTIAIIYWLTDKNSQKKQIDNKNQSEDQNEMNPRTETEEDRIDIENEMYEYTDEILGFKIKVPKKNLKYKHEKDSNKVFHKNPYDNVPTKIFKNYNNNGIIIGDAYETICNESKCEKIYYTLETFKEKKHLGRSFTIYNVENQDELEKIIKNFDTEDCHFYIEEKNLTPWEFQNGVYKVRASYEKDYHPEANELCGIWAWILYSPEKQKVMIKNTGHEAFFWRYNEERPFTDSYDTLMIKSFRFL